MLRYSFIASFSSSNKDVRTPVEELYYINQKEVFSTNITFLSVSVSLNFPLVTTTTRTKEPRSFSRWACERRHNSNWFVCRPPQYPLSRFLSSESIHFCCRILQQLLQCLFSRLYRSVHYCKLPFESSSSLRVATSKLSPFRFSSTTSLCKSYQTKYVTVSVHASKKS